MSRIEDALKRAAASEATDLHIAGGVAVQEADQQPAETSPAAAVDGFQTEGKPQASTAHPVLADAELAMPQSEMPGTPASSPGRIAFSASLAEKLVVMKETDPVSVEQYRKLAATLHQAQIERGTRVVMVASAMAGEGKTLTATNLALTLSESYRRRVLLVDADLRRPQMHDVFQVPNVVGLNEGLKAPDDQKLSVFQVSPRLLLLPAGRPDPDPMGILTSDRMRRVITDASAAFDWVILDTPPVVLLPDANLLADMVDVAVLVVAAGRTPSKLVTKAVEMLGKDRIIGVVLNQVEGSIVRATTGAAYAYPAGYGGPSDTPALES